MSKSTFTILFYARKNQVNRAGKAGIMIRVSVNGESVQFSTKLDIVPELWDATNQKMIGTTKAAREFNALLDDIRTSLRTHYREIEKFDYVILGEHPDPNISSFHRYFTNIINKEIDKALTFATTYPEYEYKVKNIITNMITSIDDIHIQNLNEDFKNWINELFVLNFLLTCPNYTIVDMERRLSNGKSADYLFRHNTTNEDFI